MTSINCKEINDIKTCIKHRPHCVWLLNPDRCEPNLDSSIKIPILNKVPPRNKRTTTLDPNSKPTSAIKPISILPLHEVKPLLVPKPLLDRSTLLDPSPLPEAKPLVLVEKEKSRIVGDECEQLNLFQNKESSCYLDSLVFGLVHIQNNKFIDELKTMTDQSETCKNRIINYLINMHTQIHNRSVPVKRILIDDFRQLLYECQSQNDMHDRKYYISEQQDVNEFVNLILRIIEPIETRFSNVRVFQAPRGNINLLQAYSTYQPDPRIEISYNTHMIYPQTTSTDKIDLRFNQLKDESGNNIFQFLSPNESTDLNIANGDYDFIVDHIYKNNLIDSSIVEKIIEIFPDFFKQEISIEQRTKIYKDIYSIFSDSLPELTYTIRQNTIIYNNPVNYFIISIVREINIKGKRNNFKLINVPERIQSYDKTLELVSAIIHHGSGVLGGHYICYFKCGTNWYIMDDVQPSIQKYIPFDITDKEIMTNCRLLIYM